MARIGITKHICVGKRVEIPAYADLWMMGARTGTIERVAPGSGNYITPNDPRGATLFAVRLDHPQVNKRLYRFIADDCRFL